MPADWLCEIDGKEQGLGMSQTEEDHLVRLAEAQGFTLAAGVSSTVGGVLFAVGGQFGGVSLFIKDGKFQVASNTGAKLTHLVSGKPVPTGPVRLKYLVNYKDAKDPLDPAGTNELYINDVKVAEGPISKAQANIRSNDEINVGKDLITPVSTLYRAPFAFTGKIKSVTVRSGNAITASIGNK